MTLTRETKIALVATLTALLEALLRKAQANELTDDERACARRLLVRFPAPDPMKVLSSWPPWASEEELLALESFGGGEFAALATWLRAVAREFRGTDVWEMVLGLGPLLARVRAAIG